MKANDNKTVDEIVRRERRECNSYPLPNAAGERLRLVREIEDAHKREIAELRSLVKELSDAIDKVLPENADCCHVESTLCKDGCMPNGKCNIDIIRAIAVKARKVLGDEK